MSPSTDPRSRAEGFSLVEVIVAMAIFMVVAGAAAPVLVGGLRAAATARDITQSKGVAQGRLEQMRDLPFYVGRAAGDFKDVLDTYYRDRAAPSATPSCSSSTLSALPPTTWTGYVASGGAHCIWERPGALYRKVVNPVVAPGLGVFSMVISTQFLSGGTTPVVVAPGTAYTSQTAGRDAPPASQVGVTIAVFYKAASGVRYTSTYSQIEQGTAITPLVTSHAKAAAVRIGSALDADTNLLEQLGVVNLSGEVFTGSRVLTTAAAATAGDSLGQQINGARTNLVAPLDQAATSASVGAIAYPGSGCTYQCFGSSLVDQASAISSNGLPKAGTPTAPVRAVIPDNPGNDGFRFSNASTNTDPRLQLRDSKPMVSLDTAASGSVRPVSGCVVQSSGATPAYLVGTGYLDASATSVEACGTAQATTIRLFPTSFAHDGVVRIVLESATASCSVSRAGGGAATAAYRATLSYWNGSSYTNAPALTSTNGSDPLASVDLGMVVDAPSGLTLGDYVRAWKSTTTSEVRASSAATKAQASIPNAVSLTTRATRDGDPTSVVSLDIGAVSCQAEDRR